ncbi:4-coumarate--CoA ligase 1-like [Photinus pyralis]|uniref:4-coumarate--CoA ligase 1-like n=1 Tax=Photinus pyralis TaxID=7054 RepID=UPI0012673F0F|nr:4-coumarate--CoA ligase 1-like [Photinus pyralis]
MEFRNNIISCAPHTKFDYTKGVGSILYEKMHEAQSAIAQVDDRTGEVDTYRTLLERCIRTAKAMRSKNVSAGDIVVVHSHNHKNAIVPVIASYFLGAIPAVIDYSLPLSSTKQLLKKIPPSITFTNSQGIKKISAATHQLGMNSAIIDFGKLDELIAKFTANDGFAPITIENPDETAAIFFTSGTTGLPKKIGLSHRLLLRSVVNLQSTSVRFTTIAQNTFWISTTNMLLNAVLNGACRVLVPQIESSNLWLLIRKYEVSVLVLVPSLIPRLFEGPISSLALLLVSGGSLTPDETMRLRAHLPDTVILPVYGQTELGGASLSFNVINPEDLKFAYQRVSSCGRPHAGYQYKVVDPDTEEVLGPNRVGEIRIKADCFSPDSCEMSEWDDGGFYKTGDLGYYDRDFCFYVTDRIKEVFKYRTTKIVPSKLEAVLKTHPAVEDAVIVGLPHAYDGSLPLGLVVRRNGFGDVSDGDIVEYYNARVADGERLRGGLRFVEQIRTTSLGKVKRMEMRQMVLRSRL